MANTDTNPRKPGWFSTEWWASIATSAVLLITIFVNMGVINSADQEDVTKMVTSLIGSIGVAVTAVGGLFVYIKSRTTIKTAIIEAEAEAEVVTAQASIANAELRKVELIAAMPVEKMSMVSRS